MSGYTGGYGPSFAPGFCGSLHNDQWFSFVANGPLATFTLTPSNCQNGDGLQMALYADCNSSPIECNGGMPGGGTTPISMTVPLVRGQIYYLVIDGYIDDVCEFNLDVAPLGVAKAPPVQTPLSINGPSTVCPGSTFTYSVNSQNDGATSYTWWAPPGSSINGQISPVEIRKLDGGHTVTITFGQVGGNVTIQPTNFCNTGAIRSKQVTVRPLAPTVFPTQNLCQADFPYTLPWGEIVTTPPVLSATYRTTLTSVQGCDSVLMITLAVRPAIIIGPITRFLCDNDSIKVCGNYFKNPGNYSVTCTSWKGCDSIIKFTIVRHSVGILGGGSLNCFNGAVPLEAAGTNGSAVWKNEMGAVVGTDKTYIATVAGKYRLEWTTTLGGKTCTSILDTVVRAVDSLRLKIKPPSTLTCSTITAILQASANMPANFQWTGPGSFASTQPNPTVTLPGQYILQATTAGGCSATAAVVVLQDIQQPFVTALGGTITCSTPTIQLGVTSNTNQIGFTYIWTGPNGFTSTAKNPEVSIVGNYTLVVTNSLNGCTSSSTTSVNLDVVPPIVSATGGIITCVKSSVTLTLSYSNVNNPSIVWMGPGSFTSTLFAPTVSTPGTYTATVTNLDNGCSATATAQVVVDVSGITVAANGGTLTCTQPVITLFATSNAAPASYQWSGPTGFSSTQSQPSVSLAGAYTVTVTGTSSGCTATATATVLSDFTPPNVTVMGGNISCLQPSVPLLAISNAVGGTYLWFGPGNFIANQAQVFVNQAGVYTVTVTSMVNGCTSTASTTVLGNTIAPSLTVSGGQISCVQPSVALNATSNDPTSTYAWSGPGSYSSTQAHAMATLPGIYTVTVTSMANGCTTTASTTVLGNTNAPNVAVSGGEITCSQTSVVLAAVSTTPSGTYAWSGPGGYNSTQAQPVVTQPGTYTVTVTDPSNGCTRAASVTVNNNTFPPVVTISSGDLSCTQSSVVLTATSTAPSSTYAWSGPSGYSSALAQPTVTQPGVYTVTVTDATNGCTGTATTTVNAVNTPVSVGINGGTLTCSQLSIVLTASSNTPLATYNWTGPNGYTTTQAQATATIPGTYAVTVTSANGCTGTASLLVTANVAPPTAQAIGGVLECNPPTRQLNCLTNVTNGSFAWTGPHGFSSTLQMPTINRSGTYYVTVTNPANGCTRSAPAVVFENGDAPQVFLSVVPIGGGKRQINCFTTAVVPTFVWTGPNGFASTDQSPVITAAGVYLVLVTDGISDCQTYQSIVVPVATSLSGNTTGGRQVPVGGWQVYPNPAADWVQLRFEGKGQAAFTQVSLLDATGRTVLERQIQNTDRLEVALDKIPAGLYRMVFRSGNTLETKVLSVQR